MNIEVKELQPPGGWVRFDPRMTAPPVRERGLPFRSLSVISAWFGRSAMPDIFPVMNINSRLFWSWLLFAAQMMPWGRLAHRDRERIILRTAWHCRSRYEWGQHVEIGLRYGLSDQDIVQLTRGLDTIVEPRTRALLSACDELVREHAIQPATWAGLSRHFDDRVLIEITLLVGHYVMVAGFLNSAGLQLEPALEQVLQDFNSRIQTAN